MNDGAAAMVDHASHPRLDSFFEPSWMRGNEKHFRLWRSCVAEMIGAPVAYDYVRRPAAFDETHPGLSAIKSLPFLEARIIDPAWRQPTAAERLGLWSALPEELLLVLVLLTVPGGLFQARHAKAIAKRLDELDELIHFIGQGWHTHTHEVARQFFHALAKTNEDVRVVGSYEPSGTIDLDTLPFIAGPA